MTLIKDIGIYFKDRSANTPIPKKSQIKFRVTKWLLIFVTVRLLFCADFDFL